jgi:FeS assembly SUF system protein
METPQKPTDATTPAGAQAGDLRERIIAVLRTIYDPEIPVDIYDLGLVYDIAISPENNVHVRMTLTSPTCPVAGTLPPEVERKIGAVEGVRSSKVEITWDPPWTFESMGEAARLKLGLV